MNAFPYDVVMFDLDGTLTCSEKGVIFSAEQTLREMGREMPEDYETRRMIGPPLYTTFHDDFGLNEEDTKEAIRRYREIHAREGYRRYSVYPHIRTILKTLKQGGAYVALVTSKAEQPARQVLQYYGLLHYFDRISCAQESSHNSEKAQLIAAALPDHFERAVMVGDRFYDIEGANEAGVDSIGAAYGYGTEEELTRAGATTIAPDTESLLALLCPGSPAPQGCLITFEGPDGSGKTTQVDLLESRLRDFGFPVLRTREPGGCEISEAIRAIILAPAHQEMGAACEALLYAAARAQHVEQVIRPAIGLGAVVLCDRFVDSSVAYQGGGRELGVDAVQAVNELALGDLEPDMTIYLSVDHRLAMTRRTKATALDRLEMEADAFHERVQKAYEKLIRENRRRFTIVEGDRAIDEIAADVLRLTLQKLEPEADWEA